MNIKFVRDDGKIFLLGGSYLDSALWGITSISGIGLTESEISTEKNAVGDGDEVTGCRIPAREIDITANVKNCKNNQVERRKALSFFLPRKSFVMYVQRNDVTRWCAGIVEKFSCEEQNVMKNVNMQLALKCVDPFFYSKDNNERNIAAVKTTFGFPYISVIDKGFNTGVYNFARQVEIENTGTGEAYLAIRIEAAGEVVNPKVMCNDAYIRVIDSLQNQDVIEIDLLANTIKKNGANCIGKADRTSTFSDMVLLVGDNVISFAADNGDTNMKVVVCYNLRYLEA